MKPFLATQYNIEPREWSKHTRLTCKDPSLAQQQFKDSSDINVLFGKYLETGEMPQVFDQGLAYGDFSGVFDYMTAMNYVRETMEAFDQLPAKIKNRFENDPQRLINFLNDPENRDEAEFLKLVKPKQTAQTPASALPTGQPAEPQPAPPPPPAPSDKAGGS